MSSTIEKDSSEIEREGGRIEMEGAKGGGKVAPRLLDSRNEDQGAAGSKQGQRVGPPSPSLHSSLSLPLFSSPSLVYASVVN